MNISQLKAIASAAPIKEAFTRNLTSQLVDGKGEVVCKVIGFSSNKSTIAQLEFMSTFTPDVVTSLISQLEDYQQRFEAAQEIIEQLKPYI